MARKARLIVPGALYHVMARCLDGQNLFPRDADREFFLSLLETCLLRTNNRCYAWVLMNTHYHLLLRLGDQDLSVLMKPLNMRYAQHHRSVTGRRGPLFLDRFKSIVTQDQNYAQELLRYVHLNPIRAGICADLCALDRYPWSGHAVLMGLNIRQFQDTATVLRRFSDDKAKARENYRRFLQEGLLRGDADEELIGIARRNNVDSEAGRKATCWVIGDQQFVARVMASVETRRLRISRFEREGGGFEGIAQKVCREFAISVEQLRERNSRGGQSDARKVFAYVAAREFRAPLRAIGEFLGVGSNAVSILVSQGEHVAAARRVAF